MDVSKFNLFGVLFNFKDKKARDDHAALAETVGVHGEDIQGLQAPTFSEPAANANVREAVAKVKSGATLGTLFTNVKAALNGLITLGEMRNYLVNNGTVTETGKYFLDAAYGKTLLDQITALNSKIPTESNFRICNVNEINLANGYNGIDGNMYLNYKGCNVPIKMLYIQQGMGNHDLTAIKVKDVYIGNVSVKSKLGI